MSASLVGSEMCIRDSRSINERTIRVARSKLQQQLDDTELLEGVWAKLLQDRQKGFIGEFLDIDSVDLDSCLLVDSFGVWERHAGGVPHAYACAEWVMIDLPTDR